DRRTWSNPSSTELASRSFRVKLRLTLMFGRKRKAGHYQFLLDLRYKAVSGLLNDFPGYSASTVEHSMSRTGLTARPRRQDTSSLTQLNEARSFLPVSVRFASTRCSMTERRSGVSSFRQPHALRWLAR